MLTNRSLIEKSLVLTFLMVISISFSSAATLSDASSQSIDSGVTFNEPRVESLYSTSSGSEETANFYFNGGTSESFSFKYEKVSFSPSDGVDDRSHDIIYGYNGNGNKMFAVTVPDSNIHVFDAQNTDPNYQSKRSNSYDTGISLGSTHTIDLSYDGNDWTVNIDNGGYTRTFSGITGQIHRLELAGQGTSDPYLEGSHEFNLEDLNAAPIPGAGNVIWQHDFSNGMPADFQAGASYPNSGTWGRAHDISGGGTYDPASISGDQLKVNGPSCTYRGAAYPVTVNRNVQNWELYYRVNPQPGSTGHADRHTGEIRAVGAEPKGNYNDDIDQVRRGRTGFTDLGSKFTINGWDSSDNTVTREKNTGGISVDSGTWNVRIATSKNLAKTWVKYWQEGSAEPISWSLRFDNTYLDGRPGFGAVGTCKGSSRSNFYDFYELRQIKFPGEAESNPNALRTVSNSNAGQGSLWIEGPSLHWADGSTEYWFENLPSAGTQDDPALSCQDVQKFDSGSSSGEYWLNPDGSGGVSPFVVYCDMQSDGGEGWMKIRMDNRKNQYWWTKTSTSSISSHDRGPGSSTYSGWDWNPFSHISSASDLGDYDFSNYESDTELDLTWTQWNDGSNTYSRAQMDAIRGRVDRISSTTEAFSTSSDDDGCRNGEAILKLTEGGTGYQITHYTSSSEQFIRNFETVSEMNNHNDVSYLIPAVLEYENGGGCSGAADFVAFGYEKDYTLVRSDDSGSTGSYIGSSQGSLWIEGTSLHWIDENGYERSFEGTDTGVDHSNDLQGRLWIESGSLHYIDPNGDERKF